MFWCEFACDRGWAFWGDPVWLTGHQNPITTSTDFVGFNLASSFFFFVFSPPPPPPPTTLHTESISYKQFYSWILLEEENDLIFRKYYHYCDAVLQFPLNRLSDLLRQEVAACGYTEVLTFALVSQGACSPVTFFSFLLCGWMLG